MTQHNSQTCTGLDIDLILALTLTSHVKSRPNLQLNVPSMSEVDMAIFGASAWG